MENKGGELEIGVSDRALEVGQRDQIGDDVGETRKSPDQILTCSSRVEPHASRSQTRRVAKPQMGGILTNNFCQVRWPGRRLESEDFPIGELLMKVRR